MQNLIYFLGILSIPLLVMLLIYFVVYGNKCKSKNNVSGLDVARKILDENDLEMTYVVETKGSMNDIYVFKQRVIRLSSTIYNEEYLSSVAIASMKASIAILDKENDSFLKIKAMFNPLVDFLMILSFILIIVGSILGMNDVSLLAVAIISLVLIFNLVMLPLNFKIKKRAMDELEKNKIVNKKELKQVNSLLTLYSFNDISNMLCSVNNAISNLDIFNK